MIFPPLPPELQCAAACSGIVVPRNAASVNEVERLLDEAGLTNAAVRDDHEDAVSFSLAADAARKLMPGHDTLGLAASLAAQGVANEDILRREILLCLLHSPIPFVFHCPDGLDSAIRVRERIVAAASRTALSFDTEAAERPWDDWRYDEETGFTLLPGRPLIDALRNTTQPAIGGRRYAFSCYRASEYVILLALAEELAERNPGLLAVLQRQWERRAIMSRAFHDIFLDEHGSNEVPLPPRFYTPGDRVWFRNPDEASSDVSGYEGSWVFYLGSGLFSNFWQPEHPYTFDDKCLEVYHWRHGLRHDTAGEGCIDEDEVARRVARSNADAAEREEILTRMARLRDLSGIYADGGCIDRTREHPRCVCPATSTTA